MKGYVVSAWFEYCEPFLIMIFDADRFSKEDVNRRFFQAVEEEVKERALHSCEDEEELLDSVCVSWITEEEDAEKFIKESVVSQFEREDALSDFRESGYAALPPV